MAVALSGIPTWTCSAQVGVAAQEPAQLGSDLVVARLVDMHDIAERPSRVDAGTDQRCTGFSCLGAERGDTRHAFLRGGADRAGQLDQRRVGVGMSAPAPGGTSMRSKTSTPLCVSASVDGSTVSSSSSTPRAKSRPGAPNAGSRPGGRVGSPAAGRHPR